MKTRLITLLIYLFMSVVAQTTANAYPLESAQRLKDVSENFVKTQVKAEEGSTVIIEASVTNFQFQVARCHTDIIPSLPINTSIDNIHAVQLSCMDNRQWKIQVPVKVSILSSVIVTKHTIPAKTKITEDDLDYGQFDKNKLYEGYFTNKQDVVGNESSYSLNAGSVITKRSIRQPVIVRNNQTITLVAQKGAVAVSMQGIAREDGALNSIIKVYNPTSKRIVESVVTGPNMAQAVG